MPVNYNAPIIIRDGRNGGWLWVDKEIWSDERLSASDKVAYGSLAFFANNKTQKLFPSITTLEESSNLSRRQVYKSIKKLEKLRYIHVARKHGKPNEYTLIDEAIQERKQRGANNALVHNNTSTGANSTPELVHNNTTNKNNKQELINNNDDVNFSYKKEVEKIADWAYNRAIVSPSIGRERFCESVEKAIARVGFTRVKETYADEENAISFLTNIKNL